MATTDTQLSSLSSTMIYIYVPLFLLGGFIATVGNVLSLIILSKILRKKRSIRVMISLAASDLLVGTICFPMITWEMLNANDEITSTIENVRVFFTIFLHGASAWNLVAVAFDRYVLITKPGKDYKCAIYFIVIFGWLLPIFVAASRWINQTTFLLAIVVNSLGPLFILAVLYILITRAVRKQAMILKRHANSSKQPVLRIAPEKLSEPSADKKTFFKLAKAVCILLLVYFCTVIPGIIWLILDKINEKNAIMSVLALQHLYMINNLAVSVNSSLNPYIYVSKTPEFKKIFYKLFNVRRAKVSAKITSTSVSEEIHSL